MSRKGSKTMSYETERKAIIDRQAKELKAFEENFKLAEGKEKTK